VRNPQKKCEIKQSWCWKTEVLTFQFTNGHNSKVTQGTEISSTVRKFDAVLQWRACWLQNSNTGRALRFLSDFRHFENPLVVIWVRVSWRRGVGWVGKTGQLYRELFFVTPGFKLISIFPKSDGNVFSAQSNFKEIHMKFPVLTEFFFYEGRWNSNYRRHTDCKQCCHPNTMSNQNRLFCYFPCPDLQFSLKFNMETLLIWTNFLASFLVDGITKSERMKDCLLWTCYHQYVTGKLKIQNSFTSPCTDILTQIL